jgi:hypothetical protein
MGGRRHHEDAMAQYHSISDRAPDSWVETLSVAARWKTWVAALRGFLRRRLRRGPHVSNLSSDWLHTFTIESAKHHDDR